MAGETIFEQSILTSVKKVLGIAENYEEFDVDIIMHINSVFSKLFQIADLGAPNGFFIENKEPTWGDFFGGDKPHLNMVRSYTYDCVRLMFDPPSSSFAIEARQRMITEMEWRLQTYSPPAQYAPTTSEEGV